MLPLTGAISFQAVMSSKIGTEGMAEIKPAFANVQENDLLL